MSILNIFKSQLSSVIEWKNMDDSTIWYKHPSSRDEIINASKLIVSPGQGCILVYEGEIKDIIIEEGIYNLKTDNHPFVTTLGNLRQNFNVEHKLYIYFFRTTIIYNQDWGTSNPIKYIDPQYNIPVELGANGTFAFRISNPSFLYKNIVSNMNQMESNDVKEIINNDIPQEITTYLASSTYAYNSIDSNLSNISIEIKNLINQSFENKGIELIDFKILGTQFNSETKKRIATIADTTSEVIAAKEAGLTFVELQKLKALRDAAKNEGGIAGIGAQFGLGTELAKQFSLEKNKQIFEDDDFVAKIKKLNILLQEGIINQIEFDELKAQILSKL